MTSLSEVRSKIFMETVNEKPTLKPEPLPLHLDERSQHLCRVYYPINMW